MLPAVHLSSVLCTAETRGAGAPLPHLPPPWLPGGQDRQPVGGDGTGHPSAGPVQAGGKNQRSLGHAFVQACSPRQIEAGASQKKKRFGCSPGHEEPDLQLSQTLGASTSTDPTDSWWEMELGWAFSGVDPRCYPQAVMQVPRSGSGLLMGPPQSVPSLRSGHETSHRFQTQNSNALKPVIPSPRFKGNMLPQDVLAPSITHGHWKPPQQQGCDGATVRLSAGTWARSSCPSSAGRSVEMSLHGFRLSDSC